MSLYFIPGWSSNRYIWDPLITHLPDHDCIALDLPGHGGQTNQSTLEDILSPVGNYSLCGWSLGSLLALKHALTYPKQIERLILICPIVSFIARPHWPEGLLPSTFESFKQRFFKKDKGDHRYFSLLMAQGTSQPKYWMEQRQRLEENVPLPTEQGLKHGIEQLETLDLSREVQDLAIPTLIIGSTDDALISLAATERLNALLPNATLKTLSQVGHLPHLVEPALCASHINQWIGNESV